MQTIFADMHSHILPGVDDGAPDMQTAMQMLSMAYEEGIRRQFLTPHYIPGKNQYKPEDLERIYSELKKKAGTEFPEMQLYLGNEIYYTPGVAELVKKREIHTMAGSRYVLVEFDVGALYEEIYGAVKEFLQIRMIPVIAHVERYQSLTGQRAYLREIRESGACLQVNARGVPGGIFDANARWKRQMLTGDMISFLGTDAHDASDRRPAMREAADWISRKTPGTESEKILWKNGESVVENRYLNV